MKTVDIKHEIRALEAPEPDAARLKAALRLCRREYQARRRLRRAGAWELIRRQLRFTALPVWGLQARRGPRRSSYPPRQASPLCSPR